MQSPLTRRAAIGLTLLVLVMAVVIFLSAGTFAYWQAWVFLASWGLIAVAIAVDLFHRDPALLERRLKGGPFAETEPVQKTVMWITSAGFIALLVIPGLDHRFAWSHTSAASALIGEALMLIGWWGIFHVFRVNTYTGSIIEVAVAQTVISTGPYSLIRHPMYAGALVMLTGIPISLGSWWSVLVMIALVSVLIWRLIEEEQFLMDHLDGYVDYCDHVRWRLIPGVW